MVAKKRRLGRGLDALLPKEVRASADPAESGLEEMPLEFIRPGKYQPRSSFTEDSIAELATSIKTRGVIQPIVVRPLAKNSFEIIAGERRWRAAQQAGLEKIPTMVVTVTDESALAMSLVENIQREDLNPLEEAIALQRLVDEFQLTHEDIAEAVGRSRSSVTNTIRLTHLAEPVAKMLAREEIDMGHARALLTLDTRAQTSVAKTIVAKGLNVRQTETLVRNLSSKPTTGRKSPGKNPDIRRLEGKLGQSLGQPVEIQQTNKGKGKLVISYNTLDELDGILARMGYEE